MTQNKKHSIDMVNGPLLKNIFIFAIPLMFTNFFQMLFNAVDTIVVGKFAGEIPLAAVGATGSICFFMTALFNGLGTGSNVVIATLLGKGDTDNVKKAVHTSITMAIISGLLLATLGFFCSHQILEMMQTPSDIIDLSALYMRIYFMGAVFMLVYNFGAAILRSKGDTKRPLYFLMIGGVVNVVLNLIFVICFDMDVDGVAIATVISQAISAILVTITLIKEEDATRLIVKELGIDTSIASSIIRIGIPAGLQGVVFSFSNVVIQSYFNSFNDSLIVAGNAAGINIENFVYIGMFAFQQATITFTSQNIGANNYKLVKRIMYTCLMLTVVCGFGISYTIWSNGYFFLSLYTDEIAVMDVGMVRLTYVVLPLVLNGILDIFVCSMRGMGYSTLPTSMVLLGICGTRFLWLWKIFPLYPTVETIYACFPISWVITCVIEFIFWMYCYKRTMNKHKSLAF